MCIFTSPKKSNISPLNPPKKKRRREKVLHSLNHQARGFIFAV
jgi:hypothetical protein